MSSKGYLVSGIVSVPSSIGSSGRGIRCFINRLLINMQATVPAGKVDLSDVKYCQLKIRDVNDFKNIVKTKKLNKTEIRSLINDEFELDNEVSNDNLSFVVHLDINDLPLKESGAQYMVEHVEANNYDIENKVPITCGLEKSGSPSAPIINITEPVKHKTAGLNPPFSANEEGNESSKDYQESLISLVNYYYDYDIDTVGSFVDNVLHCTLGGENTLVVGDYVTISGSDLRNKIVNYCPGENYRVMETGTDNGSITFKLAVADTVFVRKLDGTMDFSSNASYLTTNIYDSTDGSLTGENGGLTFRVSKIGTKYNLYKATDKKMRSYNGTISVGFTESDGGSDLTTVLVTSYFTLKDSTDYVNSKLSGKGRPNVKTATRRYALSDADRVNRVVSLLVPHVFAERDSFITYEAEVINATNNNSPTSNCIKVSNDIRINFSANGQILSGASFDQANTISVNAKPQFYVQTGLDETDQIYATVFARKIGNSLDPYYVTNFVNHGLRTVNDDGDVEKDNLYNNSRSFSFTSVRTSPLAKNSLIGTFTGENVVIPAPEESGEPALNEITFTVSGSFFTYAETATNYFKNRVIVAASGSANELSTKTTNATNKEKFTVYSSTYESVTNLVTIKYRFIKDANENGYDPADGDNVTFNILADAGFVGNFTNDSTYDTNVRTVSIKVSISSAKFSEREQEEDFFKGRTITSTSYSPNKLSSTGTQIFTITASKKDTSNTFIIITYQYGLDTDDGFNPQTTETVDFFMSGIFDRNLKYELINPYTVYECVLVAALEPFKTTSIYTLPNYKSSVIISQSQNSNVVRGLCFASLTDAQRGAFSGSINVVTLLTGSNAGALAVGGIGYTARTAIPPKNQLASLFYVNSSNVRTLIKSKYLSMSDASNVADFSGTVTNSSRSNNDILTIPKELVDQADSKTSFVLEMCELYPLKDSLLNDLTGIPQIKNSINVIQYKTDYFQLFPNCAKLQFSKPVDSNQIGKPISASLNTIRNGSSVSFGLSMEHQVPTVDPSVVLSSMIIEISDSEQFDDLTQTSERANEDSLFITLNKEVASASKTLTVPIVGNNPPEFLRIYVMDGLNSLSEKLLAIGTKLRARITYQASQVGYSNNTVSAMSFVTDPLNVDNSPNVPSVDNLTALANVVQGVRTITGTHDIPSPDLPYFFKQSLVTLIDDHANVVGKQTVSLSSVTTATTTLSFKFELAESVPSGNFTVSVVPEYYNSATTKTVYGGKNAVSVGFLTQVKLSGYKITTTGNTVVSGKDLNNKIDLKITVTMTAESANNVQRVLVAIPNSSASSCLDALRDGTSNDWILVFNPIEGADYSGIKPFIIVLGITNAGFTTSDSLNN